MSVGVYGTLGRSIRKIIDLSLSARLSARQKEPEEMVRKENRQLPLLRMLVEEVTQLSVKFYRWLRHEIYHPSQWPLALDHLKHIYAHF